MTIPRLSGTATQLLSETELVRHVLSADYEILEELGRGGMAVVYRAREKALDREVAIKVLPARLVVDQGFVERFEHEARTAAKLEHPNIVPIYRVGRAGPGGEIIYFVMKLLRGQSLSSVLRERVKLAPSDVRRILMETASALGYAAKRSVVHRDIKPDNIMLDSEGRCVITDFGIAKSPGGQQTTAGLSLGTPKYMSPEHAMGMPLDGRSDMYSLGVVAYQCLFGAAPFDAEDPFAVMYKHINEPIPEPTLGPDDERQLYGVIARMLAKKPDDRFQTANELISALGGETSDPSLSALLAGPGLIAPTELIPTPQWYMPWKKQRSRVEKRLWLALTIVMSIVVMGAVREWRRVSAITATGGPATSSVAVKLPAGAQPVGALASQDPTTSAPTPSPRAAAIIAYNAFKSTCTKRDTAEFAKPLTYLVKVDTIRDRKRSDQMEVGYDVCGLAGGSRFTTTFTLTKLNQGGLRMTHQKPHEETAFDTASSPRSREKRLLDMSAMSAGEYQLDVAVTDAKKRQVSAVRQFRIDK